MKKRITIHSTSVFLFLVLAIYIEPPYFATSISFIILDKIYDWLKIGMLFVVAILYSRNKSSSIPKRIIISVLSIWIVPLVVSVFSHTNFKSGLLSLIIVTVPSLVFCQYYIKNKRTAIRTLSVYLNAMVIINLITQILYPYGIEARMSLYGTLGGVWFLGSSNSMIAFALVSLVLNAIIYEQTKRLFQIIVSSCVILSVYLADSATATVGISLFLIIILLLKLPLIPEKLKEFINANTLIILAAAITVIFLVIGNIELFSGIIVDLLRKDLTLTTRTIVWKRVIAAISKKPIYGYGFQYNDAFRSSFGASHQHNFYLHILYQGGILAFVAFCLLINRVRSQLVRSDLIEYRIISVGIFCFLIMFITEVYDESLYILPFYLMLMMPMVDYYDSRNETHKEKQ